MSTESQVHVSPYLSALPLRTLHVSYGAKFAAFAGYEMPLQYRLGVLKEHLHCRQAAGLFDVSHMGQFHLRAKPGKSEEVARQLERLCPIDVLNLEPGRQRYAFFTTENGGVIDDLMIANRGDLYVLVANASNKAVVEAHLRSALSGICVIERPDCALLALQGPRAEAALMRLIPDCADMNFMDVRLLHFADTPCTVARSGYTGEDGFEISVPTVSAERLAEMLLADVDVELIGLGARDSLRLEAGLCLHGADMDGTTTPVEAGLDWAIPKVRRLGGARAGGFTGVDAIFGHLAAGPPRRRVGLRSEAPIRGGVQLFASETASQSIGHVTSGTFGPSVNAPVAMGYVTTQHSKSPTVVFAEVRGKRIPALVTRMPFVPHRFKR